jgi:nucleoid DNA-binding protein
MSQVDRIEKIAQQANLFKSASEKALNGCLDAIQKSPTTVGKLTLTGFDAFMLPSVNNEKAIILRPLKRSPFRQAEWLSSILARG